MLLDEPGTTESSVNVVTEVDVSDSDQTHLTETYTGKGALKRFAVLVKSNAEVERGAIPTERELAEMISFNDRLVESGAMVAGEGFLSSADGVRLTFTNGDVSVQRGPFSDPESLVAGFWIIQAGSLDEAVDLMKPAPMGPEAELEIRQVADAEAFGEELTPELREREEQQRTKMEENAGSKAA